MEPRQGMVNRGLTQLGNSRILSDIRGVLNGPPAVTLVIRVARALAILDVFGCWSYGI